jgi:hypothetical protein
VRIRIRATLDQLAAACASDDALAQFAARAIPGSVKAEAADERTLAPVSPGEPLGTAASTEASSSVATPVLRWLLERQARGELRAFVDTIAASALERWERAVLRELDASGPRVTIEEHDRAVVRALHPTSTGTDRVEAMRARLVAAVAIVATPASRLDGTRVRRMLDEVLPDRTSAAPSPVAPVQAPRVARQGVPPRSTRAHEVGDTRPDVELASVLPYLLIRSLDRIGYLDALEATAAAVLHGERELAAFATGLAYKVLDPVERGWRRSVTAITIASAFAGAEIADPELAALAERAPELVPPLDAVISRALLGGHDPARSLLVVAHGGTTWLVEPDGLFPIAHLHAPDTLTLLRGVPYALALADDAATPELVRSIDATGLRFVTSAPPGRGEHWRRVRHREALWTNDAGAPDHELARDATALELVDDVHAVLAEFAQRPAVPRDPSGLLDASLGLAAGVALADVAYSLWREREPTSSLLALRRFRDLSGRLGARLSLPLGPRRRDLERAGFLGELRMPWSNAPLEVG